MIRTVLLVLLGLVGGLLGAGLVLLVASRPSGEAVSLSPLPTPQPIVVYVVGEVSRPGIYQLPLGSRVQDAILAAGGFSERAAENALNLADRLEDGEQITIPARPPTPASENPAADAPLPNAQPEAPQALPTASNGLVNINTATLDELVALPEIGPVTAQKIIDYRLAHGGFQAIEDIMEVSGIGPATFDSIKDLITVVGPP